MGLNLQSGNPWVTIWNLLMATRSLRIKPVDNLVVLWVQQVALTTTGKRENNHKTESHDLGCWRGFIWILGELYKSCEKFGFSHDSSGKGRFPLTSKCDKIIQNPEIDCCRAGGQPKLVYYSFLLFIGGGAKYVDPCGSDPIWRANFSDGWLNHQRVWCFHCKSCTRE